MKKFIVLILLLLPSLCYAGPQTASSTTGATMITLARVILDEPSDVKWSDSDLLSFLNNGMEDIATKTLCYQATENINLVANTIEYTPSNDYIAIIGIVCNPASGKSWGLKKGNIRSRGSTDTDDVDAPVYWYEFAGKVGAYPAYTSVTTETITVYEAKRPATITSSQNIVTPAIFDNALLYYIVYQAFLLDGRIAQANNYYFKYTNELAQYRTDIVEVDNETPTPVH